mmetsp:Transcript_13651/g.33589  ORF Transcript_13651/g.33589 Transcript_13651/m.33589 type:complete len:88 (-) Transcript_13651:882-1145(-)
MLPREDARGRAEAGSRQAPERQPNAVGIEETDHQLHEDSAQTLVQVCIWAEAPQQVGSSRAGWLLTRLLTQTSLDRRLAAVREGVGV